jgi:hypothetical protein
VTVEWGDAPAWVAAVGSVGTLVVAAVAAVAAFRQVREARALREEQAQPFVVVDMEQNEAGHPYLDLVIRNIGTTLATDVRFDFSPRLRSASYEREGIDISELHVLKRGVASMPPGREIRFIFDSGPEIWDRKDLPRRYDVTVAFSSTRGPQAPLRYSIDLEVLFGQQSIVVHGTHHIAKSLRAIAKKMGASSF